VFTGIVEERGTVSRLDPAGKLVINAERVLEGTGPGDSISVSGVCLTVVELSGRGFTVDVMPETLRRSTLGSLSSGSTVNLERAMSAQGRFGGHLVNGHVDGIGVVGAVSEEENAVLISIDVPGELSRYMVPKGSVCVDGVSLTIVETAGGRLKVSVIPHTLDETTLREARPGTRVNVEVDILGKYVEAFLSRESGSASSIEQALSRGGYIEPGEPM
jgi:riboflavin synthase